MRLKLAVYPLLLSLVGAPLWAQEPAPAAANDGAQLRLQVEQMQKALTDLQQRLAAQEAKSAAAPAVVPAAQTETAAAPATDEAKAAPTNTELQAQINDLDDRIQKTERKSALDRLDWSGDMRYEFHSIYEHVPNHFDGLTLQNNIINAFVGMGAVNPNSPTFFNDLKSAVQGFLAPLTPPQRQQALAAFLPPVTRAYNYNNNALQTLRLRLNVGAKVADNVSFQGRLAMYKVFGDSTGVQVFNGLPNSLNSDGTTTRVPNSDILRVERAFMNWNNIGGSHGYISIGRRPSTDGPPMNLRQDEPRGGTPMGSLIDYQFDGITVGYHFGEKTVIRGCYGQGFDSGFGTNAFTTPGSSLSDVHLIGVNADLYVTDDTLVQATYAHAFDVTAGFDGLVAFERNPITGEFAPVLGQQVAGDNIVRYQPTSNLGAINLAGILVQHRFGRLEVFGNAAWDGLRPINATSPFGGLGSDPFSTPTNNDGWFVFAGGRYTFPNKKTKFGVEYNHGSKFWFNFAQGADDIVMPKTSIRGNAYEAYLTHRIKEHFIAKVDYIHYDAQFSGSGWNVGAPHNLNGEGGAPPILGFPSFDTADMASASLIARF